MSFAIKFSSFAGVNSFLVELWGKHSDPHLQAVHLFSGVGGILAPQVVKHFLGGTDLSMSSPQFSENNGTSAKYQTELPFTVLPRSSNTTEGSVSFQSQVQQVFFIQGVLYTIASLLHVLCLLLSRCKLRHIVNTEVQVQVKESTGTTHKKSFQFVLILLLCFIIFFSGAEQIFINLVVPFSMKLLDWTKSYASNLISLFWISLMVSQLATMILLKFFQMRTLFITSILLSFFSPVFVAFTVKLTPASLWIGTIILGLGIGNLEGAAISIGNNITSHTGVLTSLLYASLFGAFILTPYVGGYLLDNWDPMWFLFVCLAYSSLTVVCLVVFLAVQHFCRPRDERSDDSCANEEAMNHLNI